MKFRPLHDRVLIKVLDSEEKTAGGIIIPDTAKEKPQEGEVVAVGPGAKSEEGKVSPMDVKIGDIVLFGKCIDVAINSLISLLFVFSLVIDAEDEKQHYIPLYSY